MDNENFTPDLYTLEDENGELQTFELWDTLEEDGNVYYALIPVYDDPEESITGDEEFVILKLEDPESDDEVLITIDDDDEYERIGAIFLERLEKFYDDEGDEDFDGDDYDGEES